MSTQAKITRYKIKRPKGVSAVEFAFVAPVMVLLLLGSIDAGQFVNVQYKVASASREGAREATRKTTLLESDVEATVASWLGHAFPNVPQATLDSALTVTIRDEDGNTLTNGGIAGLDPGETVSVQVSLEYEPVRWLSGLGVLGYRTLTTTTLMRREPI